MKSLSMDEREDYKCKEIQENNANEQFEIQDSTPGLGYRHQQCLILFLCLTTAYSMRACMGVAVVAMTDPASPKAYVKSTNASIEDGFLNKLMLSPPYPQFNWSKKVQDMILSSFFWGYMLLQIPGGQLAHRYGAKYLIFAAMLINAVVSICLPWAAFYGGKTCVIICRVIQGLSQACLFPSCHTFFGKWAPLQERGRLTALVYGGQALGTVLGLPLTGFIAASKLGWPGIFRFYGLLSGIVACVWFLFGADAPASHPHISASERDYIERGLGQTGYNRKEKIPVPWKSILTSKGMWAIVIAHIGHTWGQLTLYSEIPSFMSKVMKVNIRNNGLLTALPFMVMFFANFFFSWVTDFIIINKWLSVTNTRKLANTLGGWPPALLLIVLALAPKNIIVVESLLVLTCAMKIAAHLGFQLNHIDISPNFAGTMMSISNFASNGISSLAPIAAGYILTDERDEHCWRNVFYLAAAFYFVSNLVYIMFGTAKRAAWDTPSQRKLNTEADLEATKPIL